MRNKNKSIYFKMLTFYLIGFLNIIGATLLIQLVRFCFNWIGGFNV